MTALTPQVPPRRRFEPARTGARAVCAALALLALIVGVPVLLLRFGHWPITGLPSWSQIRELPTTIVSDEAVPTVLQVVPWATWALFVACVIAEAVAQLRGRSRAALRLGGPLQRAAASLVGSLVMSVGPLATAGGAGALSLAAGPPASAAASPADAASAAPTPAPAGTDTAGGMEVGWSPAPATAPGPAVSGVDSETTSPEPRAETQQAGPTITVRHGDSPWSLATAHLGDGTRWRQIWELNRGRPQPDGGTWADPEAPIRPGWQLVLPGDATGAEAGDAGGGPGAAERAAGELTVQPGDSFWRLAEAELAEDWGRAPSDAEVADYWVTVVDDNRDRLLPPGDPDLIYPGQTFTVPAPPADPTAPPEARGERPAPSPPNGGDVPDAPSQGDREDRAQTPSDQGDQGESRGNDQEGGDQAGATPTTETAGHAGGGRDEDVRGDESGGTPTTATTERQQADEDARGDESDGGTPTTAGPGDGAEPPTTEAPDRSQGGETAPAAERSERSDEDSDQRSLPVGLIGGGVALAGVVVLLDRRRRAQQRYRRPGQRIAMPSAPLQQDEVVLRHGADVDGARLLDAALRTAAAGSGAAGLPPLRWVEVQGDAVLLVLSTPSPAPPGFTNVGDERWLTSGSLDELESLATHAEMPAPTLIPVGTTADDAELLVELEASAVITVTGAPDQAAGLLRAIAVAAATSPWSEQSQVLLVGLRGEVMDLPWVAPVDRFADALAEAETRVERTTAALWSMRCQSTGQARASGVTPEAWAPLVVVSALPPSEFGERQRLTTLANRPRSGVAFATASAPGAGPIGRTLAIGDDGWLRIDGVDVEVRPDRLDEADAEVLTELLDVAAGHDDVGRDEVPDPPVRRPPTEVRPAEVPAPPVLADDGPPAPDLSAEPATDPEPAADLSAGPARPSAEPGAAADLSTDPGLAADVAPTPAEAGPRRLVDLMIGVDVLVRVLGEVEAVRLTGPSPEERLVPIRQKGLEAIVYMALREAPVDREELESRLFPDGANAAKTVYNTISAARGLVGEDLFPAPTDGRYALSDTVVTDYGVFCELVAQADETDEAAEAAALLTDALSLVRTEPFMGVGRNYAWVGAHRGMIVAQVIDAAEELAEIHLARNDWRGAEWAARRGLRAFPADERMHRVLMRTARAAGNIPGVQRVFRELCEVVADPDLGVEPEDTLHPETITLLEELTGSAPRRGQMGA